jgi:carboxyvinyl-carboxyphosphonate phosphorylmutase
MTPGEKRQRLRAILSGPICRSPATVYDALSARIAEAAGFETGILSGSVCAATLLAGPDMALQTLTEFADQARRVTRAGDLSLFVDADQGYGNALNAMRTVEELEHAGVAGLSIEDLVMPARFGSGTADELISTEEMVGKMRAALSARRDPQLVIAARTASVRIEKIESVVARVRAYAATGVDAIFVTGLRKLSDFDAIRAATTLPFIIGTAPGLKREDFAARGVRFCLQGHSAVAAAAKALRDTYDHLHAGGAPAELGPRIASPDDMSRYLGADTWRQWREGYLN